MIPFRTTAPSSASVGITMSLIVTNIGVFLYQIGLPPVEAARFLYTYALVPVVFVRPDIAAHAGLDSANPLPFLTNTFMHGGYLHLIFNMWTLWLFGGPLEGALGRWRYLAFYLGCGIAGSLGHFAFNLESGAPALGASGAIAGVLGAFTLYFTRARVLIVQPIIVFPVVLRLPAVAFTVIWFGLQVWGGTRELGTAGGAVGGGIAWWAHIFGFAVGFVAAWLLRGRDAAPIPRAGPWT